jgi:predicted metal-dependent phosphoesterase TrpH
MVSVCTVCSPERQSQLTDEAKALYSVLATIGLESCPQHYNFHMHTVHSDGQLRPESLMEQAVEIGLQGLAITDHHNVAGYREAQDWLQNLRWRRGQSSCQLQLWTGVEINAELLGLEVHILGYGFDPDQVVIRPYLQSRTLKGSAYQAVAVIQAIQQAGGIAVLAHPARYRRPVLELIDAVAAIGIDGVEAYYAYGNPSPWIATPQQTNDVCELADRHRLLKTCGTDTHGMSLLRRL